MLFGADRNITRVDNTGTTFTQRTKVLPWPQNRAALGYAGQAEIGGVPADEWFNDFIGRNSCFQTFEALAEQLRSEVERQRRSDEGAQNPEALIIHLGGFELRAGIHLPTIWLITNVWNLVNGQYCDFRKEFKKTDEFWHQQYKHTHLPPTEVRDYLGGLASKHSPFWFHQGFDLGTFNILEGFVKEAFKTLCDPRWGLGHSLPCTLSEWESQVRMSVLTYGAYFSAYKGQGAQFVGGGADVVSIPWPEQ